MKNFYLHPKTVLGNPPPEEFAAPLEPTRSSGWLLAVVSVAMAAASLIVGWILPIHLDDVFYLHNWWLVAQGYIPHRDFFSYTWGIWVWLAPLAQFPWTPSSFIIFGRTLIAACFGLSFWLVGRLVRAYRWEALVLGAVWLELMLRTEFYTFRRAFLEILLCLVHLTLLERTFRSSRPGRISGLAGFTIGMTCMISQRGIFNLPIQPIVLIWFFWKQWEKLRSVFISWILGFLAAVFPAIIYIMWHNLWAEEWAWNFVFPSSIQAHYISEKEMVRIFLYGVLFLIAWIGGGILDHHIPIAAKKLLAFCSTYFFITSSIN
ncbi:MAG TPA: hypothetical protein PLQ00_13930, partial [Thermoguttaceae bacterium]|nr:hypothetical protein [Thermoguttaceae bacterium]